MHHQEYGHQQYRCKKDERLNAAAAVRSHNLEIDTKIATSLFSNFWVLYIIPIVLSIEYLEFFVTIRGPPIRYKKEWKHSMKNKLNHQL